jgi:uncharacterized protein DUF4384
MKKLSRLLIAVAVASLVIPTAFLTNVAAQKEGAALWYSTATVKRVSKPNRVQPKALPTRQRATLLALQWHLLKRANGNVKEEVDSTRSFENDDQVKLAVRANQNGYLYIINQPEGKDGAVIFPDPRIRNGLNYVLKNTEYVIPSYCPGMKDPNDCWFKLVPPAGRETMVVIFSRDKFKGLPSHVAEVNGEYTYPTVSAGFVKDLIAASQQKVETMQGKILIGSLSSPRYSTLVQNSNKDDNEELITTIEVNHGN